jgi:hypothetical protein
VQLAVGIGPGDLLEEGEELLVAVAGLAGRGDLPGGDLQRGEQGGGAVPDVVVRAALGQPRLQRRIGAVRSSAWIWDFSSTQSTIAFSGGCKYNPTTSTTFASSCGSVENRNDSARHGATPYSRHARATVASPIFKCLPNSRLDQCVTPYRRGGGRSVAATICRWSRCRGRPDRAWSSNPARPRAAYRLRQPITVGPDTPTSSAIAVFDTPSAASSTIRARSANPARTDDDRVSRSNTSRSPTRNPSAAAARFGTPHRPTPKRQSTNDAEH